MKIFYPAIIITLGFCLLSPKAHAEDTAWNEFQYGNNTLSFQGYSRLSTGAAFEGGDIMPMFIAPGAQSKYRLGNESDTYLEFSLDYHYYLDDMESENARYVQLYGTLTEYQPNPEHEDIRLQFDRENNPQSFIKFGNFLGDGTHAWFGRRFYDRRDIHIMDHYWLNVAQGTEYGGGIEGISLGGHNLDIAAFTNKDKDVPDLNGTGVTSDLYSHSLDLRYRDIPTSEDGALTLWAFGAYRGDNDTINYDDEIGFGLGGWHTQQNVMGGRDIVGLTFRQGVAMPQGLFNSRPIREGQGFDVDDAWSIELNNDWMAEFPDEDIGVQWATVLRHEERGQDGAGGGSTIDWLSTGVRPVFYLNDYFSIATEVGLDFVDNEIVDASGFLGKGTVALQLAPQKGFFERPVLRLFVTGAVWSDDLEGHVANANPPKATSYADNTAGLTYGLQFEWWW